MADDTKKPGPVPGTYTVPNIFLQPRKYGPARTMVENDFSKVCGPLFKLCSDALRRNGRFAAMLYFLQVNEESKIGYAFPVNVAPHFEKHGDHARRKMAQLMNEAVEHDTIDFSVMITEASVTEYSPQGVQVGPPRDTLVINLMSRECQAICHTVFTKHPDGRIEIGTMGALEFVGIGSPSRSPVPLADNKDLLEPVNIGEQTTSVGEFIRPRKANKVLH